MNLTPYFPPEVMPHYNGWYLSYYSRKPLAKMRYFKDGIWYHDDECDLECGAQEPFWCGLAEMQIYGIYQVAKSI